MRRRRVFAALGLALLASAAGAFMLVRHLDSTEAATTEATMALNVKTGATGCDGPAGQPTKCDV
ncbi:MAG: hypothetical protein Q8S13_09135, partial [Dehalococcoidia bacterium]|nr:hypothetical protein [Dehalococcoidia bacterium]